MDALLESLLSGLPTIVILLIIVAALYLLSKGADVLVDEAVSLSIHWGIPKMVVGATIVSLGTTLPEATVSVLAAVNGNPDLALGNAIGSIIADTGLIIGVASMLGKLPIDDNIIHRQGRIQFWAAVLLSFLCLPLFSATGQGHIAQWVGFIFIVLLIIYIIKSLQWAKTSNEEPESLEEENEPLPLQIVKLIIGVALVIFASKVLIPSVEVTAIRIGIPESIIAATLVAFGTSLPELVTAITATKKGHGELAVGNVVGADILNIFFVIGAAASVTPDGLSVPTTFYHLHIPTLLLVLILFRLFCLHKSREITKKKGIFLLLIYVIYIVLNYFMA